jgi:hypothetical protein
VSFEEKMELQNRVYDIIRSADETSYRSAQEQLNQLIEIRRGPLGRWLAVRKGAPKDYAKLRPTDQIGIFGILDWKRTIKRKRYLKKKSDHNYKGPLIVAEGDSWFEFPLNTDLLDWIGDRYAVLSLAKAGDAWPDIINEEGGIYGDGTPMGLFATIDAERPQIVLLSAGGNDFLGNIEAYVYPFEFGRPREQYIIREAFDPLLDLVEVNYREYADVIVAKGAKLILHAYDYPDPRAADEPSGGQWIGEPLEAFRRIGDHTLWRQITIMMLDMFAARLRAVASSYPGKVFFVDQLGTIGTTDYEHGPDRRYWHDELHGTDEGFQIMSKGLIAKIAEISGTS